VQRNLKTQPHRQLSLLAAQKPPSVGTRFTRLPAVVRLTSLRRLLVHLLTHWFALAVVGVAVHLVHYKPLAVVAGPVELLIPRQLGLLSKPTQLR
jgi:hypothetical protein